MKRTCRWNDFKGSGTKMNEKFSSRRASYSMRVPFERSNNQLINTNIFG